MSWVRRVMDYFRLREFRNPAPSGGIDEDSQFRSLEFNKISCQQTFVDNSVSTGKYTFLTFIPMFIFLQMRKAANLFFFAICILQQIPDVSPTGKYTTLIPLTFILFVAGVKEVIEDYKRHMDDRALNSKKAKVHRNGNYIEIKWDEIRVGDIVKVVSGQFFPADMILLSSSEPQAMCYVETAMLDGETNLKIRQGLPDTANLLGVEDLRKFSGLIECDEPNNNLYDFNGNIKIDGQHEKLALGLGQTLLRGCMLRNTEWALGVVVYTGHETKIMMNSKKSPLKRSNVERTTNTQIYYLLVILIIASLASTIGSILWEQANAKKHDWYIGRGYGNSSFFFIFLTFVIVYNNLVPISLIVTLEVVKFIQAIFINNDIDMYCEVTDTPARAKTSNLNEELGQIQYIFTDKTGTLTQNVMVFRKASIAGVRYGDIETSDHFEDGELVKKLTKHDSNVEDFIRMMAVCHTVVPECSSTKANQRTVATLEVFEETSKSDCPYKRLKYQSSSPDEDAIIKAARSLGFVFYVRTPNHILIDELGTVKKYEILNVLEFSSTRKRMSVIIRKPDQSIWILCKGADEVIFQRLNKKTTKSSSYREITEAHLKSYASEGLRTLCFAQAQLDEDEYQEWNTNYYEQASKSVNNRESLLEAAYERIETNLSLIGASAIEDKLQDGVPETIDILLKANIKIWVLTGDKIETAINIANSCKLIQPGMNIITLDEKTEQTTLQKLNEAVDLIGVGELQTENNFALVISGLCLKHAINFENKFVDLALSCKAVVCCRVSPIQKAEIVELVKSKVKAITLAIGDGGNDVSMIQAADVGVGISGMEGLQAANASDYSIGQFRFLKNLLLVHGAWNFSRLAKCILFSFYKNICLYLIQLWFAFYNGFSGQILFERWTIALYNVFFTSLQPFAIGIFDRMFNKEIMLKYPQLYTITQKSVNFNGWVFWKMCINATFHSALLFFISSYIFGEVTTLSNGTSTGYLFLGACVYTVSIIFILFSSCFSVYKNLIFYLFICTLNCLLTTLFAFFLDKF